MRNHLSVTRLLLIGPILLGACQSSKPTRPEPRSKVAGEPRSATNPVDNYDPKAPVPAPIEVREQEYENGAIAQREEGYVAMDGSFVRHGPMTTWYEDGAKKSEIQYAHGKAHGARVTWYPTGQMWGRGEYDSGAEHGIWTAWWPNGFKQREWHMNHGTWHGSFIEWHDNGEKKMEFEYVNGVKQGAFRIWDPQGTLVHETEFVNDVEQPK